MNETCWIMISAIATAAMAVATFITIVITLKQQKEALRARLLFSIVLKDDSVFLKVANVGNSVATDIHIQFSQNFKDMLISNSHRERFESLEQTPFSIDAHDAKFYTIIPATDYRYGAEYSFNGDRFSQRDVNEWHEKNNRVEFEVSGSYCGKYEFKERMSIYAFLNIGAVEINEVASVIRRQNEILKGIKNDVETIANRR